MKISWTRHILSMAFVGIVAGGVAMLAAAVHGVVWCQWVVLGVLVGLLYTVGYALAGAELEQREEDRALADGPSITEQIERARERRRAGLPPHGCDD